MSERSDVYGQVGVSKGGRAIEGVGEEDQTRDFCLSKCRTLVYYA